jgi:Signal peptidase, peptidase S26
MTATRLLLIMGGSLLIGVGGAQAGDSDQPARIAGRALVTRFLGQSQPDRHDVVIFKYPETSQQLAGNNYIKRLLGLPGETLVILDGTPVSRRRAGAVVRQPRLCW